MPQSHLEQFLLTPPDLLPKARAFGLPLGHMAWQLDAAGRLRQAPLTPEVRGGLMLVGISASPERSAKTPEQAAGEIINLCRARRFTGVILDLECPPSPFLSRLLRRTEEGLRGEGKRLYLPAAYANFSSSAYLYLSSAISGGSLEVRLTGLLDTYGSNRLVLCLRRARDDFFLPSPKGQGRPLSQEAFTQLRQRLNPAVFYSKDLCAHYFTYMSRETGAHFVLFDDGESFVKKRALAAALGISRFFLLYPETEDLLPALLM